MYEGDRYTADAMNFFREHGIGVESFTIDNNGGSKPDGFSVKFRDIEEPVKVNVPTLLVLEGTERRGNIQGHEGYPAIFAWQDEWEVQPEQTKTEEKLVEAVIKKLTERNKA